MVVVVVAEQTLPSLTPCNSGGGSNHNDNDSSIKQKVPKKKEGKPITTIARRVNVEVMEGGLAKLAQEHAMRERSKVAKRQP